MAPGASNHGKLNIVQGITTVGPVENLGRFNNTCTKNILLCKREFVLTEFGGRNIKVENLKVDTRLTKIDCKAAFFNRCSAKF
jgi:hypothetical protein